MMVMMMMMKFAAAAAAAAASADAAVGMEQKTMMMMTMKFATFGGDDFRYFHQRRLYSRHPQCQSDCPGFPHPHRRGIISSISNAIIVLKII